MRSIVFISRNIGVKQKGAPFDPETFAKEGVAFVLSSARRAPYLPTYLKSTPLSTLSDGHASPLLLFRELSTTKGETYNNKHRRKGGSIHLQQGISATPPPHTLHLFSDLIRDVPAQNGSSANESVTGEGTKCGMWNRTDISGFGANLPKTLHPAGVQETSCSQWADARL